MKFSLSLETDSRTNQKINIIQNLDKTLKDFLKEREYGNDVQTFYIGLIVIEFRKGY